MPKIVEWFKSVEWKQKWIGFKEYVYQNVIAINQLINTLHGGSADETICCRTWLKHHRYPYKAYLPILDGMFYLFQGKGHCEGAWKKENGRRHYSKEMLESISEYGPKN